MSTWILFLFWIIWWTGNSTCTTPEVLDLSRFDIVEHSPCYNRLILKIVPSVSGDDGSAGNSQCPRTIQQQSSCSNGTINSIDCCAYSNSRKHGIRCIGSGGGTGITAIYNSSCSVNSSSSAGDREKVLFIGFEESWERDLWSAWLIEVIV